MIKQENKSKIKDKIYKIIIAIITAITAGLCFINSVYATGNIESADLHSIGECGNLLKYKGTIVKVSYIQYENNGVSYPAYCLDKTKPGVETTEYAVSVKSLINDVGLWRRVVNGYPYKTLEDLGVLTPQEAFTATKQAIYCYVHGNNPEDYEGIGEAGQRTLNALKKIVADSENSSETKISNNVKINKGNDDWKQDNIDKNYLSKEYSISSESDIKNYRIEIINEDKIDIGGIKLTDLQNREKSEFAPNEKFKIMIPIKNLTESGSLKIKVDTKMKTKPVLYGTAPDSSYQDYAVTMEMYEDSKGETTDYYSKNETKLIIQKQEKDTQKPLENVEFEILNEKKEIVYNSLKTNSEGKIIVENLIPGKYYIREVNTIDGYKKYEDLISVELVLHEQVTVNVYNEKEETPKISVDKMKKSQTVRTLPVTGM